MSKDLEQALLVGGLVLGGYALYARAKSGAKQDAVSRAVSDLGKAAIGRAVPIVSATASSPRSSGISGVSASKAAGVATTSATVLPVTVAETYDRYVPAALAQRTPETLDSINGNGMTAPTLAEALALSALSGEPVQPAGDWNQIDLWAVFAAALGKTTPDPLPAGW